MKAPGDASSSERFNSSVKKSAQNPAKSDSEPPSQPFVPFEGPPFNVPKDSKPEEAPQQPFESNLDPEVKIEDAEPAPEVKPSASTEELVN